MPSCFLVTSMALGAAAQGTSKLFPPGWNKEAVTPPMGWRSWNAFGPNINNATFVTAIDALVAKNWHVGDVKVSLSDVGYGSVGIDEGWENCSGADPNNGQRQHDAAGFPMVNTEKFPSLKWLVDYGHAKGVKMGWYLNGCACGERKERLINYQGDIQRLHEYGFDAAKFDGCGAATNMTYYAELMANTGRTFAVENCHWGSCGADKWYHNPDGSSCPTESWCPFNWFRTSGDINRGVDSWFANLQTTIKFLNETNPLSVPSCWAYPDMMEVGEIKGGNVAWSRAHFGAWCVVSAPLILGVNLNDTATLKSIVSYVTNEEAIAVNQQWAGHPGRLVQSTTSTSALPIQVWVKPQPKGKMAVYVVNPTPLAEDGTTGPLECFDELPATSKKDNVCFGEYPTQFPALTSPAECAAQCMSDAACTMFVWALPTESGNKCRISRTCDTPTSYLAGFDGYVRRAVPQCGPTPPPPAVPAVVTVPFALLGAVWANVTNAAVRDVWLKADLADVTAGVLTVMVPPMDSVFVVLDPK